MSSSSSLSSYVFHLGQGTEIAIRVLEESSQSPMVFKVDYDYIQRGRLSHFKVKKSIQRFITASIVQGLSEANPQLLSKKRFNRVKRSAIWLSRIEITDRPASSAV